MEFLTQKHISRRAVLKGMGVTVALPVLEAMVPVRSAFARTSATAASSSKARLVAIEMVHGSAGSTQYGIEKNLWAPAAIGRDFDLSPGSLSTLTPFKDYLTIVSNTDVHNADAFSPPEVGGDHFRSSAVYLTQSHPKQTQGSDVLAGTSLDQFFAGRFGQDTPIPSMQLCIEAVDQAGGCAYGYSCVYTDSISWASPKQPLPMVRDPRVVFDQLFGVGATPEERDRDPPGGQEHPRLDQRPGGAAQARPRAERPRAARRLPRRHPRDRAPHPEGRGAQQERRAARAARGADRRARFVRRARQADVRPAGAGLRVGRDARLLVQDGARRLRPRVSGQRRQDRLPPGVAPPGKAGTPRGLRQDQQVPREHGSRTSSRS